mmetsp:Transcript_33653/g.85025  ORF Transcript_33653/g.85025 Transcript_33653/m.85025 type:complete len:295 (-) Transcript_33653:89-973(-)
MRSRASLAARQGATATVEVVVVVEEEMEAAGMVPCRHRQVACPWEACLRACRRRGTGAMVTAWATLVTQATALILAILAMAVTQASSSPTAPAMRVACHRRDTVALVVATRAMVRRPMEALHQHQVAKHRQEARATVAMVATITQHIMAQRCSSLLLMEPHPRSSPGSRHHRQEEREEEEVRAPPPVIPGAVAAGAAAAAADAAGPAARAAAPAVAAAAAAAASKGRALSFFLSCRGLMDVGASPAQRRGAARTGIRSGLAGICQGGLAQLQWLRRIWTMLLPLGRLQRARVQG